MYYDPFFAAAAASQAVVNDPGYHRLQVCKHIFLKIYKIKKKLAIKKSLETLCTVHQRR